MPRGAGAALWLQVRGPSRWSLQRTREPAVRPHHLLSSLPALGRGACADLAGRAGTVGPRPGCSGPKIKVISERKTSERWPRVWAWGKSTQIRGSEAVVTPEWRVRVPGRESAKGGPALCTLPAPNLEHQAWSGRGNGPRSGLPSWLSDPGPVQRR